MSEEIKVNLTEELDRLFIEECGNDSLTQYSELDEDDRWVVEQAWGKIITRISQAIADGMPLPGEQRRYPYYSYQDDMGHGDFHAVEYWGKKKPDGMAILIALSPSGIPAERKEEIGKERAG